jgi:hypothetical protein
MSELAQVLNIDLHRAFIDASRVEEFAQHFSNVMATGTAVKEVLASAFVSAYGPDTRKWLKDNDVISKARELYIKTYHMLTHLRTCTQYKTIHNIHPHTNI